MPSRRRFHDFLEKSAKFPYPQMNMHSWSVDISPVDATLLEPGWKAERALRDDGLVARLCLSLENTLGDTLLTARAIQALQASFSPDIEFDDLPGEDAEWKSNRNKADARHFVTVWFFEAIKKCLRTRPYAVGIQKEMTVAGSQVDSAVFVNDNATVLVVVKSPSVMMELGNTLPAHGIVLTWPPTEHLVPKTLTKVALYLGMNNLEWLFLTCFNLWIVCRLVRCKECTYPYLTFSPMISIENSTLPFRMVLGAILAVVENSTIDHGELGEIDPIVEAEEDLGPLPEDDGSGPYWGGSREDQESKPQMTHSQAHATDGNIKSELLITTSKPDYPENFQTWIHLTRVPNDTLAFPLWDKAHRRLRLTEILGSKCTDNDYVWRCRFEGSSQLFAAKIAEVLCPSDMENRKRLYNEFKAYRILERVYQSRKLTERIAPRCYGAFESDLTDMLILDSYDSTLSDWNEIGDADKNKVFKLVQDLHAIGISHGDLRPWHIAKVQGGGFYLIDFSAARKHKCREIQGQHMDDSHPASAAKNQKCYELQLLRHGLWSTPIY